MEASKTVSTCTLETVEGMHVFDILGYSKHRGMGLNKFIRSGIFAVGGHEWSIRFYPDGYSDPMYISIYLELMSKDNVRASCDLRLVDRSTGLSSSVNETQFREFNQDIFNRFFPQSRRFMLRSKFEASAFLQDDRLTVECIVTVIKEPHVTPTKSFPEIGMPPSDMTEHVGKLLEEKEGCDVSFSVGGQTFEAHRFVLSMRSPVFKAELYSPMKEAGTGQSITIKDMQPSIFRALLHFIYTDALPADVDLKGDESTEMIRHLLVTADRYAMDRLKLVCQSILCKNLNVETVATTLALADQHNCDKLRDACLEFITCSNAMDAVVETQAYKSLKRSYPSLLVDAWEKTTRFSKA